MKAYELIAKPENWTQGAPARTKYGRSIYSKLPEAFSFCVKGAINVCYDDEAKEAMWEKLDNLTRERFKCGMATWNDDPKTTHEEVIKILKRGRGMNYQVGDQVVVTKPDDIDEYPSWVEQMDVMNGQTVTIVEVKVTYLKVEYNGDRWNIAEKWVKSTEPIDPLTEYNKSIAKANLKRDANLKSIFGG